MPLEETLRSWADPVVEDALVSLDRCHLHHYEAAGRGVVRDRLRALYDVLVLAIARRDVGPMLVQAEALAGQRFASGFDLGEVQTAFNVLEEALWSRALRSLDGPQAAELIALASTVLGLGKDALARSYVALATRRQMPPVDVAALFAGTQSAVWKGTSEAVARES